MANDKIKHLVVGIVLLFGLAPFLNPLNIFIITVIIAATKEIVWDKWLDKGTPDVYDFLATIAVPGIYALIHLIWL